MGSVRCHGRCQGPSKELQKYLSRVYCFLKECLWVFTNNLEGAPSKIDKVLGHELRDVY